MQPSTVTIHSEPDVPRLDTASLESDLQPIVPERRHSTRERFPPQRYCDFHCFLSTVISIHEPPGLIMRHHQIRIASRLWQRSWQLYRKAIRGILSIHLLESSLWSKGMSAGNAASNSSYDCTTSSRVTWVG